MMQTYTQTENLISLLEQVDQEGVVYIRRDNGQLYVLKPQAQAARSPLDIPGVDTGLTREEIIEFIHEGRGNDRW